jgi:hypothetical protein
MELQRFWGPGTSKIRFFQAKVCQIFFCFLDSNGLRIHCDYDGSGAVGKRNSGHSQHRPKALVAGLGELFLAMFWFAVLSEKF